MSRLLLWLFLFYRKVAYTRVDLANFFLWLLFTILKNGIFITFHLSALLCVLLIQVYIITSLLPQTPKYMLRNGNVSVRPFCTILSTSCRNRQPMSLCVACQATLLPSALIQMLSLHHQQHYKSPNNKSFFMILSTNAILLYCACVGNSVKHIKFSQSEKKMCSKSF